jgi:DNA-binding PadR family transcriptional regulator
LNPKTSEQSSLHKSSVKSLGKGYMRGMILAMLAEHPRYGYEILHALNEASDGWRPSPGTIYPILHDLYDHGLITRKEVEQEGRRRIIYKIGVKGKTRLEHDAIEHVRFVAMMRKILGKHGAPHFPGSPAFNVDKALRRLEHLDLLLDEAALLPEEIASDPEHGLILLKRRLKLLEKHARKIKKTIQNTKKKIRNLEEETSKPKTSSEM